MICYIFFMDRTCIKNQMRKFAEHLVVEIGTTDPTNKLHAYTTASNSVVMAETSSADASGILSVKSGSNLWQVGTQSDYLGGALLFRNATSGFPEVLVDKNGNVGIGATDPMAKLHLEYNDAAGGSRPAMIFSDGGNDSDFWIGRYETDNSGTDNDKFQIGTSSVPGSNVLMNINADGNVGIGTTSPGYILTVNGEPAANGFTAFTNYSDERLKRDIQSLDAGVLDKVCQLQPKTFYYNAQTGFDQEALGHQKTGFIAQEIKNIFPEMVGEVAIEGVSYYDTNLTNLQVYLVDAVKELRQEKDAQIEMLKQENNELRRVLCLDHPEQDFCQSKN